METITINSNTCNHNWCFLGTKDRGQTGTLNKHYMCDKCLKENYIRVDIEKIEGFIIKEYSK